MKVVASAGGVDICAGDGHYCSFFSSPYQSHRDYAAVDVYQGKGFGEEASSPVEGTVHKIVECLSPTPEGDALPEYLLLIENGSYLVRMMHVKPSVKVGQRIKVGDPLGEYVKSGFFAYWVEPHIHVEIRPMDQYMRARGGLELSPEKPGAFGRSKALLGSVTCSNPRATTIKLDDAPCVTAGNKKTMLDGSLFLDYAGVYGVLEINEEVHLNDVQIGVVESSGRHMSIFRTEKLSVSAGGKGFAGASFLSENLVKLKPAAYGATLLKEGKEVEIEIKDG